MLVAARRAASTGALPWPAALIVWGPGALSSAHAHHCVQLVLALEGRLRVRPRPGSRWQRCHAVVISPDVQHEIDARNLPVLIGFIDAESSLATGLAGASAHAIAPVPAPVALRWRRVLGTPGRWRWQPSRHGFARSSRSARPASPRPPRDGAVASGAHAAPVHSVGLVGSMISYAARRRPRLPGEGHREEGVPGGAVTAALAKIKPSSSTWCTARYWAAPSVVLLGSADLVGTL